MCLTCTVTPQGAPGKTFGRWDGDGKDMSELPLRSGVRTGGWVLRSLVRMDGAVGAVDKDQDKDRDEDGDGQGLRQGSVAAAGRIREALAGLNGIVLNLGRWRPIAAGSFDFQRPSLRFRRP